MAGGKAEWYHNRYIKAGTLERNGGPPAAGGPRRGARDTVNTNVLKLAGKTLALVESGPIPFELDQNLDTVASTNLQGTLSAPFTAHPHEDPQTGSGMPSPTNLKPRTPYGTSLLIGLARLFPNAQLQ